jgi:type IV secretory pathway VirB2 component (pilin)
MTKDQCSALTENRLDYTKPTNVVWNIVQFILLALGGVAVIMIIVGGIQYATSQGESATLTKAKNTILYAVIGLVVALSAAGIVTFITNSILK